MMPQHVQQEYDKLTPAQQAKFNELMTWSNAGQPGQTLITDMAYDSFFRMVKNMGDNPDTPAEPDRTVNHEWDLKLKQGSDQ